MKKIFFALLLIAGIGIWFYMNNDQIPVSQDDDHHDHDHSSKISKSTNIKSAKPVTVSDSGNKDKKAPAKKYEKPKKLEDKPETEEQALAGFAEVLSSFKDSPIDYEPLVEQLNQWQLVPKVAKNSNPYTGEMAIIRTDKTLPGTRYFHAQYFSDENGENHLQHMSFEFRPGPAAFNQAIKTVSEKFGLKGKPQYQKNDFASWNTDNGYIIWIKKMGPNDLEGDPFNAYSKDDVGTIRVAVELEIHEGPGHDESEHLEVSPE